MKGLGDMPFEERQARKLLITGCGRSGTTHTSRALSKAGFDMPHEQDGKDGHVCWYCAAFGGVQPSGGTTSTYTVHPNERVDGYAYRHIVHQVRHPVKVVASVLTSFGAREFAYINAGAPEVVPVGGGGLSRSQEENARRIRRAMLYWRHWNLSAERLAELTYRVEDIADTWPTLCRMLGSEPRPMPDISKTANSQGGYRKAPPMTWEHLERADGVLARAIRRQAEGYGYE